MRTLSSLLLALACALPLAAACSSGDLSVGDDQGQIRRDAGGADVTASDSSAAEAAIDAGACGPSPAGCMSTGCPTGERCVVGSECAPSSCACDAVNQSWACTPDCGGGRCVPDAIDAGPSDAGPDTGPIDGGPEMCGSVPNPAGCVSTGCPNGKTCTQTSACFSSACACDGVSNVWMCTPDCSGGECI